MRTMYDSISAGLMPPDGDLYAGYVDGRYANLSAVRANYPGRGYVSISAIGSADADVIDVEPGCVWPPTLASSWLARNPNGVVYCAVSQLAYVSAELGRDRLYWTAHYDRGPHLCSKGACGYDTSFVRLAGTQWAGDQTDRGYHYDQSLIVDGVWSGGLTGDSAGAVPVSPGAGLGAGLTPVEDMLSALSDDEQRRILAWVDANPNLRQDVVGRLDTAVIPVLGTMRDDVVGRLDNDVIPALGNLTAVLARLEIAVSDPQSGVVESVAHLAAAVAVLQSAQAGNADPAVLKQAAEDGARAALAGLTLTVKEN